jgi:hypothetical protein
MGKKYSRKQMIGCSRKTRKNYLGGSADTPLAYTGKPVFSLPNPYLAYTGKGGANVNAADPSIPNTGPVSNGANTIFSSNLTQHGGNCGCGTSPMVGGKKGGMCPACALALLGGGKHRNGCRCRSCKGKEKGMKGGNAGIPYPNGLVGTPWTPNVSGWPGVDGVAGDSNYYPINTYNNDISRQMAVNPPLIGGRNKHVKKMKQRGGTLSNFLGQDLLNLGRQFQFGVGSAYNALAGYSAPVNPLPWKDQFHSNKPSII